MQIHLDAQLPFSVHSVWFVVVVVVLFFLQVQVIMCAGRKLGLAISIHNVQRSTKMLLTIPTSNAVIETEYTYWSTLQW